MSETCPESWGQVPLERIADLQLGKMLDKARNTRGTPLSYLRNINVRWHGFDLSDLLEMRFDAAEVEKFMIADGDVLVCEGGEPGRAAVWRGGPTNIKFQKAIHRVRCSQAVLPDWVALYLKYLASAGRLADHFTGSTIKHLPAQALAALPFPLPPVAEQRRIMARIVALLVRTRRARADLKRVAPLAARHRRQILHRVFDDATAANEPVSLGSLLTAIEAGKNIRCEERRPTPGERGIVKISAVTWGRFNAEEIKTAPVGALLDRRNCIVEGDFLLSRANTLELVGAPAIAEGVPPDTYLSDKVLRLRFHERVEDWTLWFLRSPQGRAEIEARSSGNQLSMRNIGQAGLRDIPLPLPNAAIRRRLVDDIERNQNGARQIELEAARALALLDHLEQSILTRAFRGELVPHDRTDEPAGIMLGRLRAEPAPARRRRGRT